MPDGPFDPVLLSVPGGDSPWRWVMNLKDSQIGVSGEGLVHGPMEIAQQWVEAMQDHNLDGVVRLYAPAAILHLGDRSFQGRVEVRKYLGASRLVGARLLMVEILGNGDIHIRWGAGRGIPRETHLRIERGEIAEQWVEAPEATLLTPEMVEEPDQLDRSER
jgi:hypothetical protein